MRQDQATLSTADFAKTPETVQAEAARQERERVEHDAEANRQVEPARSAVPAAANGVVATAERPTPLFPETDATDLRKQWVDVQTSFVDEPRRAVEQAGGRVASVMKRLAESFAGERASLEGQWDRGDDVTTEDLRVVMQRYRSFFDRLLSI